MTGKRKRETLEELLARPWCYYCERDFDDQQVLQTHQREMHFHCEYCSRRLNTASGLSVHTDQVHKQKVTRIRNTIEGRESPDIEIFGVRDKPWGKRTVGIPEELVQSHRQSIIDGYYQLQAQHRARTGNPLPGTVKHDPNKKGKREETPAEMKARLQAKMAAKKAAKEAAARGEQSSQTPENQTPAESDASPPAAFPHMQADAHVASGLNQLPPTPFQPTLPFHHEIATFQPQPPIMANSPPNMSNGYPYGYPPGYPAANNYGTGYYSHPTPTMPYTQVPRTQSSPNNMNATHLPMPSAPGLPQRPSFDAPALTKNEMAAYHGQSMPHARGVSSPAVSAPPPAMAHPYTQGTQHAFGATTVQPGMTDLHAQGTQPALGASAASPPPLPPAREATPPPPPEWNHMIHTTRDKAAAQGLSYDQLQARDVRDGSEKTIYEVVATEMKGKSGGHLVWFNQKGVPGLTFEEVKRKVIPLESVGLRIDANATPVETTIAE